MFVANVPQRVGFVAINGVWDDEDWSGLLCDNGGGLGDMRSSTGTSISVTNKTHK
jgi:hypothetical protein